MSLKSLLICRIPPPLIFPQLYICWRNWVVHPVAHTWTLLIAFHGVTWYVHLTPVFPGYQGLNLEPSTAFICEQEQLRGGWVNFYHEAQKRLIVASLFVVSSYPASLPRSTASSEFVQQWCSSSITFCLFFSWTSIKSNILSLILWKCQSTVHTGRMG